MADTALTDLLAMAEEMDRTLQAVYAIDPEEHATKSRDYGRGFAEALRVVRDEIDTRRGLWAARRALVTASRTDRQPPTSATQAKGGESAR